MCKLLHYALLFLRSYIHVAAKTLAKTKGLSQSTSIMDPVAGQARLEVAAALDADSLAANAGEADEDGVA